MDESKNVRSDTYENAPMSDNGLEGKLSRKEKAKRHCKRFWWLHLTIFIILTLLIVLLLIFVAMPRIAQNQVNDSELEVRSQTAANPTPEQVDLVLESVIINNSPFHPRLDAFNASLYLPDAGPEHPFFIIETPEFVAGKRSEITLQQTVKIQDMDQFIEYTKRALINDTFMVGMSGTTDLHQGAFPVVNVNFTKLINTTGMNGLKGFEVTNFTISLEPDENGNNMNGTVSIPNPSDLTVVLGNLTQNVMVDGDKIGEAYLDNVVIRPGDNHFNMTSRTDQAAVIALLTTRFQDGMLPVQIVGNYTIYNGEHLPYYEAAFAAHEMETTLDVGQALAGLGLPLSALTGGGGSGDEDSGDSSSSTPSSSTTTTSSSSETAQAEAFGAPASSTEAPEFGAAASSSAAEADALLLPTETNA